MAYTDRGANPRQRAATAIAVLALEAAAVVAIVNGLAVTFLPRPAEPGLAGEQIDLPKPPPSDPKPVDQRQRDPLIDSKSRTEAEEVITFPTGGDAIITGGGTDFGTGGSGGDVMIEDPPKLPPAFPPRAARPRNAPGLWATADDYPAGDLRAGRHGVTRFRLSIGTDGRVRGCEVIASSGSPTLDAATCDKVSRRARFDPAMDETGAQVAGSYAGAIRWVIPD